MMEKLNEFKMTFNESRQARILAFVAALLLTIPNMRILMGVLDGQSWSYVMLVPTAAVTLLLYYLSDGIPVFMVVVKAISSIAHAFSMMVSSILAWMMFLGSLFAVGISLLVKVSFICGGIAFAYALPGLFVPAFYLIAKAAHLITDSCNNEDDKARNVNYDKVFENVMDKVEN